MIFNHYFEPIAQPNDNIKVLTTGKPRFFKVIAIEPLPSLIYDFGAISAGSSITQDVPDLYVNDEQLAQYRIKLIDDIQLYIKQPTSSARFATQNGQFVITQDIAGSDLTNLTEFYILEGKDTSATQFVVKNPSTSDIATSRVLFAGYKFKLEELKEEPENYITISIDTLD